MMDRDKRLTGHKRGQQVREQTISSAPFVHRVLALVRQNHTHQRISKRTASGIQRGPHDAGCRSTTLFFLSNRLSTITRERTQNPDPSAIHFSPQPLPHPSHTLVPLGQKCYAIIHKAVPLPLQPRN